eukprot:2108989-Amphidinium_carterae.1
MPSQQGGWNQWSLPIHTVEDEVAVAERKGEGQDPEPDHVERAATAADAAAALEKMDAETKPV